MNEMLDDEIQDNVNPDYIIEFTQKERLKLLPSLDDNIELKITLLNSLSSTAISTKRLSIEETTVATDKELANAIGTHMMRIKTNPYYMGDNVGNIPTVDLGTVDPNLDETSTDIADLSMDEFML